MVKTDKKVTGKGKEWRQHLERRLSQETELQKEKVFNSGRSYGPRQGLPSTTTVERHSRFLGKGDGLIDLQQNSEATVLGNQ